MLALTGFSRNINFEKAYEKSSSTHTHNKKFPLLVYGLEDNNELIYNESEKSEFEIELDWISFYSYQNSLIDKKSKSKKNLHHTDFSVTNQKRPLYDLFCKWKLHLS